MGGESMERWRYDQERRGMKVRSTMQRVSVTEEDAGRSRITLLCLLT